MAQAGHRGAADVLARLTRHLRSEERIWRAISRLALGLYRRTRLAAAARRGDAARCAFLLAHGADARAVDAFGRTPLDEALAGGHAAAAAVLRGAGAVDAAPFGGAAVAMWGPVAGAGGRPDEVWSLASLGGGRIAVGHDSGAIVVRDTSTGSVTATLVGHADAVLALVALPGGRVASAGYGGDHSVRVWSVATGAAEAVLAGHTNSVRALAVVLDGRLASGSDDGSVRLWDVRARVCTAVLAHGRGVNALAALPCGGVASGGDDGCIVLWSAAGARMAVLGDGAGFGAVFSLAMLPDGRLAAGYGGRDDNVVRVWDVPRRAVDVVIRGHARFVRALAALPGGCLLSGSDDHTLKVWDERPLSVRGGTDCDTCAATLEGHTHYVFTLAVLPDRSVASGSLDGTVHVWR